MKFSDLDRGIIELDAIFPDRDNRIKGGNKVESINCIFCGKESKRIVWTENGYTGRKCDCGLIYISPRPSTDEIKELYTYDHGSASADSHIQAEVSKRLDARFKLQMLKKYINRGSLLEIGPGAGYFLDEARKEGFEVFGNELNLELAKFISEKLEIPVETAVLNDFSFHGIKFDIVYHCDVLSHFYDPFEEFSKFNNRLNKGGLMIFETGKGDLSVFWLKFMGRLQFPDHLFFYSRRNIEQLCERTGFTLIGAYRYSIVPELFTLKLIRKILGILINRKQRDKSEVESESSLKTKTLTRAEKGKLKPKSIRRKMYSYLDHFMRYHVGRIFPKFGPETIIYVARKKKQQEVPDANK